MDDTCVNNFTAYSGRAKYLDQAKGLGILCIVFLHYENGIIPWTANTYIGSFMITIFYIVAGWIMAMKGNHIPTRLLVNKRMRSLGLPYLYWTGIILAFDLILWLCGYYNNYFIAREVYKSLVLRGIGTLWFLPALFFGEIIWNWLSRRSRMLWVIALAVVIIYQHEYSTFFASRTSTEWNLIKAPFYTINSALGALLSVAAGFIAYKIFDRTNLLKHTYITLITGVAMCVAAYFTANFLNVYIGDLSSYLWPLCAPIFGPLGFVLIFFSSQRCRFWNYFDYWGRNSLSLMVTHYSIVQVLITILIVNVLHYDFYGWVTILAFIASMPVQYLITQLIDRFAPQLLKPAN